MKVQAKVLTLFLLCVLVACGLLGFRVYSFLYTPPEPEGREVFFDVQPGARLSQIAQKLLESGLITDAEFFVWLARYEQVQNGLKAGRFALQTDWLPQKVLDTLVYGRPVLYRITIPEGLTYWQTGALLVKNGFLEAEAFHKLARDPEFLANYGIPFKTVEGFLMPDTYLLKKAESSESDEANDVPAQESASQEDRVPGKNEESPELRQARRILGRLIDNFWQRAQALWPNGKKPDRAELMRLVTLASIVEKETALEAERPRVAGVYINRLVKNMLLQADPTVIYGLGPTFSGRLLYRHLDDAKNPYNTYQRQGLPPGPICSFGMSSLKAALMPEKHAYLYFVAKEDGGQHIFSVRLEEHNRAVRQYRMHRDKKKN